MPFALIIVGVLLVMTALNNTWRQFGSQFYKDMFSTDGGFVFWAAGITIVGLIGYIPAFKKPADAFIVLIIFAMIIKNGGFFSQLEAALQAGPSGGATTGSTTGSTNIGNLVLNPTTANSGAASGQGGIGSDAVAGGGTIPFANVGGLVLNPTTANSGAASGQGGIGSDAVAGGGTIPLANVGDLVLVPASGISGELSGFGSST